MRRGAARGSARRRRPRAWIPAMTPRKTMISPALSKSESMKAPSLLAWPVARASVPSNMSKTPPMKTTRPPTTQGWRPTRMAPDDGDPEPDERQRRSASARPGPCASAIGSKTFLKRARESLEIVIGVAPLAREAMPRMARSRSATSPNASGRRRQMVSRPTRRLWIRPAARRRLRWWLTSGCDRPTCAMSSRTRGLALGQPPHDAQAVHVGEGLVEGPQVAEVFGLE